MSDEGSYGALVLRYSGATYESARLRMFLDLVSDLKAANAEIERLRGAYEQERKDCINLTEKIVPNLRDEIERLRGLLREAETIIDAATVEHFALVEVSDRKGLRGWSEHPMLGQITRWKEKAAQSACGCAK